MRFLCVFAPLRELNPILPSMKRDLTQRRKDAKGILGIAQSSRDSPLNGYGNFPKIYLTCAGRNHYDYSESEKAKTHVFDTYISHEFNLGYSGKCAAFL
jgi:hypothetical protein